MTLVSGSFTLLRLKCDVCHRWLSLPLGSPVPFCCSREMVIVSDGIGLGPRWRYFDV